jgi:tetratricopeptide (TPR) repeat protein
MPFGTSRRARVLCAGLELVRHTVLTRLSRKQDAVAAYTKALDLRADDTHDLSERADILLDLCDYEAALSDLNRLLELQPRSGWALHNRAVVLFERGHYVEAIKDLSNSLAIEDNPETRKLLAETYAGEGRMSEAIAEAAAVVRTSRPAKRCSRNGRPRRLRRCGRVRSSAAGCDISADLSAHRERGAQREQ